MRNLPPLQLIFDQPLHAISDRFGQFVAQHDAFWIDQDYRHNSQLIRLQYGCLGFDLSFEEGAPLVSGYRTVFTHGSLASHCSMIGIDLSANLGGGERSPPIAAALLSVAAQLSGALQCQAIKWNPANLLCDPTCFAEAVANYGDGGAFPVLVTIDFDFLDDDHRLRSKGLSWFSGQEFELSGDGLHGQELVRRAVRLVHDIATNGPVIQEQYVPDLDPANRIHLSPNVDEGILHCSIAPRISQMHGVSGTC